ncbi:hypothetical protein PAMP_004336 [Pampus punctatissimus]
MEESGLLKQRLQAITEKHRIQEDIRQKKQELDHEKLKLQHLKVLIHITEVCVVSFEINRKSL